MKKDIRQLTKDELIIFFEAHNEKKFRASQVWEWLWAKSVVDFESMSNLTKDLRNLLSTHFEINSLKVKTVQKSTDGTLKVAFQLHDGHIVEGVLITSENRMTACISSQVGCSLTCKFCATGYMERKRNLTIGEIYDQVVLIDSLARETYSLGLSNIVLMGMGEPLLNYSNVLNAIDRLTNEEGLNISSKRITLSTVGISKMIHKMGDDMVKFNLALSIHAANDKLRNEIMPINETNNLKTLQESLMYFQEKTNGIITLEYILFKDFNDTIQDATELWNFAKKIKVKINIIEYNPIAESNFKNTSNEKLNIFSDYLKNKGLIVNVRKSRGKDIDAACGQLANKKTASLT